MHCGQLPSLTYNHTRLTLIHIIFRYINSHTYIFWMLYHRFSSHPYCRQGRQTHTLTSSTQVQQTFSTSIPRVCVTICHKLLWYGISTAHLVAGVWTCSFPFLHHKREERENWQSEAVAEQNLSVLAINFCAIMLWIQLQRLQKLNPTK